VDFAVPPDLVALAAEARALGATAAATRPRREQSWIGGFDREFSQELGRRGWLGMTWPRELGGAGRSNFERFVVAEALIDRSVRRSWPTGALNSSAVTCRP
jgi:alkylation response protein AidB-like acyl-CoA dehydrogenase